MCPFVSTMKFDIGKDRKRGNGLGVWRRSN